MKPVDLPTSVVRELYYYDGEIGRLRYRRHGGGRAPKDSPIGSPDPSLKPPRIRVSCRGGKYMHTRLVWQWHHGDIPDGLMVNHIDMDTLNDRIENLDLRSRGGNKRHSHAINNKTGYRGVSRTIRGTWTAYIKTDHTVHLGTYDTPEEAAAVYEKFNELMAEGQYKPPPYADRLPQVR